MLQIISSLLVSIHKMDVLAPNLTFVDNKFLTKRGFFNNFTTAQNLWAGEQLPLFPAATGDCQLRSLTKMGRGVI